MKPTLVFADAVGRKKMAKALQVLPTAVSNAVGRDNFPPAWYETCRKLADDAGIDCPPSLFVQRPYHNTPSVDGVNQLQGAAE